MTQHKVQKQEDSLRIDKLVTFFLKDVSRSFLSKNIKDFVKVDGNVVKPSYRVKEGQEVDIDIDGILKSYGEEIEKGDLESNIVPQKSNLDIVHEDANYIVLKKPSGLVVHPGIGHEKDTLANYIKQYLIEKEEYDPELKRAGIVHRLDMPVNGLIVFAKNRKFQKFLSQQFENHEVLKIYFAEYEVLGGQKVFSDFKKRELAYDVIEKFKKNQELNLSSWEEVSGVMKRDVVNRKRMVFEHNVENEKLRYAKSYILPLSESQMYVLIKTGRMHQIRATMRSLGLVLKGDRLYGWKKEDEGKVALSSVVLGFTDMNGEKKVFNILN